jgi:radical SAM superfamily enzyme YgiQ (UPF0313 family)
LPRNASLIPAFRHIDDARHGVVLTSLGCPMSCSYCASGLLARGYRTRPAESVADEIFFHQTRFGVDNFAFYDDALLYKSDTNLLPLIDILVKRGIFARFHVPNGLHVQLITPQILDALLKAGFSTLRFGYESGKGAHRQYTKGKTTRSQLAQKISLMTSAGFKGRDIGVYVMAGFPDQSPGDTVGEIDKVASLGVMVKPVFLSPVPGTPIFNYYAGLFPQLRTDPLYHNDSFFITLLPGWDDMAVQKIMDMAKIRNAGLMRRGGPAVDGIRVSDAIP